VIVSRGPLRRCLERRRHTQVHLSGLHLESHCPASLPGLRDHIRTPAIRGFAAPGPWAKSESF
jgi:hypothetical protein